MRMTSKQLKRYVIRKSKGLARAVVGMMKVNEETLGAFAAAGKKDDEPLRTLQQRVRQADEST